MKDIPVSHLIKKMEDQLGKIKNEYYGSSDSIKIQEGLHAIKTYCDLLLEAGEEKKAYQKPAAASPISSPTEVMMPQVVQNIKQPAAKKLNEEDANGDSLFDF